MSWPDGVPRGVTLHRASVRFEVGGHCLLQVPAGSEELSVVDASFGEGALKIDIDGEGAQRCMVVIAEKNGRRFKAAISGAAIDAVAELLRAGAELERHVGGAMLEDYVVDRATGEVTKRIRRHRSAQRPFRARFV